MIPSYKGKEVFVIYTITGITGKVGGGVARTLMDAGLPVRAVVRSKEKGEPWENKGCEVTIATIDDAQSLIEAFTGAEGVFLMVPPIYDPEPGVSNDYEFPEAYKILEAVRTAIDVARPGKVVYLSTVGGHVQEPNLLNIHKIMEDGLRSLSIPITILRAAWFMENAAWDVDAAKNGFIHSFLNPLDHPIPMIATIDISRVAAELLRESWTGTRIVELEGPQRYSSNDIGAIFSRELGHPVRMETVPRAGWEEIFRSQGMKNPMPRMRMIDGFNEGWIDFEGGAVEFRKGQTSLDTVLRELVRT
ncbi:NmrA family NAD(P)-binding protein [Paenibacillus sp. NPDC057934]|uniref:NmrA family NAD(P)-binding protein n=1 Tax=Paenibacillus sp. NPDC057934 TaxID=3346282 RepID=UPI0036DA52AE